MGVMQAITALLISLIWLGHSQANGLAYDEIVTFELPVAPLTTFQKKQDVGSDGNLDHGSFTGHLQVPHAENDLPAIVLFHTCHGTEFYRDWIRQFHEWNYATLSISRCQPPDHQPDDNEVASLDWKRGALVAFGALNYLSGFDGINADKIVVSGWSRLGMIPLSVLNFEGFSQFFDQKFQAGFALYPFCSFARGPHGAPMLIISGGGDTYIDNKVCERISQTSKGDRFPITHVTIPDALHGFDIASFGQPRTATREEVNPDGFAAGGGVIGYNRAAHTQAVLRVKDFLDSLPD